MIPNTKLQLTIRPRPAETAPRQATPVADPLRAVRTLKRWMQIGVYTAILGTEPFYYLVLHYSVPQLLSSLLVGLIIATVAIEGAFGQMFKFRKRSAYPNLLLQELSQAPGVTAAAEQALAVINRLLAVRASFVALRDEQARLQLVSSCGMSEEDAARGLEHCQVEVLRVLEGGATSLWDSSPSGGGAECLRAGERVTLAPLSALTRTLGVLALVGTKRGSDLKDAELIQAVATALGLSIENLRDKEELAQAASLLSSTLESTADGILVVGQDGKTESFNAKFAEMWGIPRSILDSRDDDQAPAFVLDKLKDPDVFLNKVRELYAEPEAESYDTLVFKDGRVFDRFSQPRRLNGRSVGRVWGFRDVTVTKRAEEALVESERRFRSLIENGSDGIMLMSPDGTFIYAGPSTERLIGYAEAQLVGRNGFEFVHPDDLEAARRPLTDIAGQAGTAARGEFRVRHVNGSWRWIDVTTTNLVDEPAVRAVVVNYRDVTARVKAEQALRESEEQFRSIQDSALDAIITMNADGVITSWNQQAETIFGWTHQETVGRSLAETLIPSQHREAHGRGIRQFIQSGEARVLNTRTE